MKKLVFAALTLLVLAGSTFSVAPSHEGTIVAQTKKKPTVQPLSIPPPSCPYDDPNGCGIFG
jgi:hypothetical protein